MDREEFLNVLRKRGTYAALEQYCITEGKDRDLVALFIQMLKVAESQMALNFQDIRISSPTELCIKDLFEKFNVITVIDKDDHIVNFF